MRMNVAVGVISFFSFLLTCLSTPVFAQDDPIPVIDWQKRLTTNERLTAFGSDLMGDSIDTHLGSLNFSHTDVSIPGNSNLDVSIRRKLSQGYKYDRNVNVEFGDWQLDIPKITAITSGRYGWAGNRCSGNWGENFPAVTWARKTGYLAYNAGQVFASGYSNGVTLEIPGQGSQQVLKNSDVGAAHTVNEWKLECTTATDGGQGFIAHAPNGDQYDFKKFITRPYKRLGFADRGPSDIARQKSIFLATEVRDVNGNWVRYTYDTSHRLTRISSNDGRVITLSYSGTLISSVTANGRRWSYSYRNSTFLEREWGLNPYRVFAGKVLSKVTRPDGLSWTFNLDAMQAEPAPPTRDCYDLSYDLSLQHPNGTKGEFHLESAQHRQAYKSFTAVGRSCVGDFELEPGANSSALSSGQGFPPPFEVLTARTLSVTSKTLTSPTIATANWSFSYEQEDPCTGLPAQDCDAYNYVGSFSFGRESFSFGSTRNIGQYVEASPAHKYVGQNTPQYKSDEIYSASGHNILDFTNQTEVTQPDGSVIKYFHVWDFEEVFGGKEVLRTISKNNTELERVESTYAQFSCNGREAVHSTGVHRTSGICPTPTIKTVQSRDGDRYTSEMSYNLDRTSSGFSYGSPVEHKVYSNISGSTTPRVTTIEYEHNKSKWILGLSKTVEVNNRLTASYNYDSFGRKTQQYRYGQSFGTFAYYADGTLKSITDPLNRKAQYSDWHRGSPQMILRQDGVTEKQRLDDNGWVISSTDGKNYTINYRHDNMGRLTRIDPPGSWANTEIAYNFSGGGAVQTITKGQAKTTVTYDAMFRPILERSQALDTNWSSYVKTEYDGLGRVIFKSQPSINPNETKGVDTTYDGLGRVYDVTENVAPYATTRHRYYSGHLYRKYDPSGAFEDYYGYGYDGPGNTDYRAIFEYDNNWRQGPMRHTYLYKNVWGQMTRLRQWGSHDNQSVDQSQFFYYDSQQRLCRHYVPEHGATQYQYDAAGQMTAYAKGQANSGCGTVSNSADRVAMTYDTLGRLTKTDFTHSATPDITRSYDANGNVLRVNRGVGSQAVNWTYAYDDLNNLTSEKLDIDGRNYDSAYSYNTSGYMTRRAGPNGRVINYTVDGLGRMRTVKNGSTTLASNVNYHPSGSVHQMSYGNGQLFSQILNARLLPQRLLSYKGSTRAIDQTLSYDARGLVTSIIDGAVSGNNRSYSYDGLGYLKTASGPWGTGSYKYDSLGNLRQKKLGSRTVNLTYDTRNRLTRSADSGASGTRTVAYDNRGNVTTLGNLGFIYDKSDQPVAVSGTANGIGAANGNYRYDGNLKRVKSIINGKTIYNVYDASGKLVHIDKASEGKKTDYVSGPAGTLARITNGAVTYLHPDHLGSAQAGTNSVGTVAWREQYTPFGEQLKNPAANDNLDGFTGHIKDKDTGLNYMQARYYDPVIGRFLSVDPVTFMDLPEPGQFNRYAYTWNDPINAIDPTGEVTISIGGSFRVPTFGQTGSGLNGVGAGVGVAVSFPVPFLDPSAQFDAGVFGTIEGSGGISAGGTGKITADFGAGPGSVKDLSGTGLDVNAQVPVTPIPGTPIPNPIGPSVGGTHKSDYETGEFKGVEVNVGVGSEVAAAKTLTGTLTVRDVAGAVGNLIEKFQNDDE